MIVKNWIVEWFLANTYASEEELLLGQDLDYFKENWLDSIGFINLLADIEEFFDIELGNDVLQEYSTFSTIGGLAITVEGLRGCEKI